MPIPLTILEFIAGVDLAQRLIEFLHWFILSVFSETLLGTALQIPPRVVKAFLFFPDFFWKKKKILHFPRIPPPHTHTRLCHPTQKLTLSCVFAYDKRLFVLERDEKDTAIMAVQNAIMQLSELLLAFCF